MCDAPSAGFCKCSAVQFEATASVVLLPLLRVLCTALHGGAAMQLSARQLRLPRGNCSLP